MESKYDGFNKITNTRNILLATCEELQGRALDPSPGPACLSPKHVVMPVSPSTSTSESAHTPAAASTDTDTGVDIDAHALWSFSGADTGVRFSDITGAQEALQTIRESLILPVKFPTIFRQVRAKAWKALMLYGPPGTGKSMIARATASESSANFYNACCAELTSKWVGGSEKLMKSLFAHACANSPSIVFFDEIDSIAGVRDSQKSIADQRLTNQMLIELDGCVHSNENVFVMAATNLPWQIDVAVLRRFPKRIYISLPGDDARGALFCNACVDFIIFTPYEITQIVSCTSGFSGADICNIVNDVGLEPLRLLTSASSFIVTETAGVVQSVCVASGVGEKGVNPHGCSPIRTTAELIAPVACSTQDVMSIPDPLISWGEWAVPISEIRATDTGRDMPDTDAGAAGQSEGITSSPETKTYVLRETSLEEVIERFTEHAVRVAPVTFAMVMMCISRCRASVDRANVVKYEEYNKAQ